MVETNISTCLKTRVHSTQERVRARPEPRLPNQTGDADNKREDIWSNACFIVSDLKIRKVVARLHIWNSSLRLHCGTLGAYWSGQLTPNRTQPVLNDGLKVARSDSIIVTEGKMQPQTSRDEYL